MSDILEFLCLERNVAGQKIRILNQKFISHGDKLTTPVAFVTKKNAGPKNIEVHSYL